MAKKKKFQPTPAAELRIIGGRLRGSKLLYNGDPATRPMKDRTREAVFNLVGPSVKGKHAIDLFAGTGALGLEAISRGAAQATLLERNFKTARLIRDNAAALGIESVVTVAAADTFFYSQKNTPEATPPWLVFCSPPYDFFVQRTDDMLALIDRMLTAAPPESVLIVESDARFETETLPQAEEWDVRTYRPAVVAMLRKN